MTTLSETMAQPRVAAHAPADVALRRERRFFTGVTIAMALFTFVGFAPSYYLRAQFGSPAFGPVVHLHGLAFTMWIALLVTQTSLVAAGRTQWHRQLGIAGAVLAVAMTVLAATVALARGRHVVPGVPHDETLAFLAIPFVSLLVFPTLIGAGIRLRKSAAAHKRLVLLGTIEIVTAAAGRLVSHLPSPFNGPPAFFAVADLFVLALVVFDLRTRGRCILRRCGAGSFSSHPSHCGSCSRCHRSG